MEMVELLIKGIGSPRAREENNYDGPPTLKKNGLINLKKWLTRAHQNIEDGAQAQMSIRSEIQAIIQKYSHNDGEN